MNARGKRTRGAILEAAEQLFARRGYAGTRLEDVAEAVGIRRSSILHYFPDKPRLYDAVLAEIFAGLLARIQDALEAPGALRPRIEAAVSAWVDYVVGRPSLARILLREVADGGSAGPSRLARHTEPFFEMLHKVLEREPSGTVAQLRSIDALHLASTVGGPTLFLVGGLPSLLQSSAEVSPEQIERHRAHVLSIARRYLAASGREGGER